MGGSARGCPEWRQELGDLRDEPGPEHEDDDCGRDRGDRGGGGEGEGRGGRPEEEREAVGEEIKFKQDHNGLVLMSLDILRNMANPVISFGDLQVKAYLSPITNQFQKK